MMWPPVLLSILIALALTLLVVGLVGWRRPGAGGESAWLSALLVFLLLSLGLWASSAWLAPRGPLVANVPWAALLVIGAVLAVILVAVVPQAPTRRRIAGRVVHVEPDPAREDPRMVVVATGFGVVFWVALFLLLAAAVGGMLL